MRDTRIVAAERAEVHVVAPEARVIAPEDPLVQRAMHDSRVLQELSRSERRAGAGRLGAQPVLEVLGGWELAALGVGVAVIARKSPRRSWP